MKQLLKVPDKRGFLKYLSVLAFLLVLPFSSNAQSLTGLSGGFSIPNADFQEDKTMFLGYSFLNKKYSPEYVRNKQYDYSAGFFTITFLPFAEVSVRITYPNGYNAEHENIIIGDRMISGRLRLLKEKKYIPSLVLGLQGFYKTTGDGLLNTDGAGASFFNSSYLVMTKTIRPKNLLDKVGVSLGYGSDFIAANTYQFIGLFGGINFSFKGLEWVELMMEYDADKWNAGTRITIFKHVVLLAGLEGLDAFSFGVNYRFKLP